MKKLYIFLIFSFSALYIPFLFGQDSSNVMVDNPNNFAKAFSLQTEGNNKEAINIYEEIINSNTLVSSEVFNNLGLAYLAENKIGNAVLNFARAVKYKPTFKMYAEHLELAESKVQEAPQAIQSALGNSIKSMSNAFSTNAWMLVALGFSILAAIFIKLKKNNAIIALASICLVFALILGFIAKNEASKKYAVLLHDKVTLKQSADLNAANAGYIYEGTRMEILEQEGEWLRIMLADGVAGWIPASLVTIV